MSSGFEVAISYQRKVVIAINHYAWLDFFQGDELCAPTQPPKSGCDWDITLKEDSPWGERLCGDFYSAC